MNLVVTQSEMVKTINNYFTGIAESATCSGERPFDINGSYRIFKSFFPDGRDLIVSGKFINECYFKYNTSIMPSTLAAKANCNELIIMLYKRIAF